MNLAFAAKLCLTIRLIGIGAQKIDGSALKTYGMIIAGFSISDMSGIDKFFEETFLLADTSMKVVLGMPFLPFSNVDIQFDTKSFTWSSYSTAKAFPTTKQVELIDKQDFAKATSDKISDTFIVHIAALKVLVATNAVDMPIHSDRVNQVQVPTLQQEKTTTKISLGYADYADIFSPDLTIELLENTGINKHTIELKKGKQPPYGSIYSLDPMELETLKLYIETQLKPGLFNPLSLLQVSSSFLIRSLTIAFAYTLIIEDSII